MKQTEIEWLTDPDHKFKTVTHISNRKKCMKQRSSFTDAQAQAMGYKSADHIKYSNKTGKNTLGSNPFMMEGL